MHPTITLAEANRVIEQNVKAALTALPDTAKLKPFNVIEDFPCEDPDDGGPPGRSWAERSDQVIGLDPEKIPEYYHLLRTWWLNHGFTILREFPDEGDQRISVERKSDGFRMGFQANHLGKMYLESSSPCVWPNGTPEPGAAPARVGEEPPMSALADESATEHLQPPPQQNSAPSHPHAGPTPRPARHDNDEDEDFRDIDFIR